MTDSTPTPLQRKLITLFTLAAAFMTQLDTTIANVALPHMQASTSASREQITWVLTSYIVTAAMFTPLSGWLSSRFGRRTVMVVSIAGFTVASMLCGAAANFEQLIAFRVLQGFMGSALLPMSQAIMLDINPPERRGAAMALWGLGAILGPIVGPVLGGFLTESMNWRWVFYINLPFGIIAAVGLLMVMPETGRRRMHFDVFGFALLAIGVGAFQLMLDRGQVLDWFQSTEIMVEATLAAMCLYLFVVHSLTARHPFVNLGMFADPNYAIGSVLGFFLGGLMYSVMALLAPMMADLMQYPIERVGIVSAPRGFGTMAAMLLGGRIANRADPRVMILLGLVICGVSTWMLAAVNLQMDDRIIVISGFVQGIGAGLMFVPITATVFATIDPRFLNEGTAFNSLIRNLGGAVWISVLQAMTVRNAEVVHARLAEGVRPDNPAVAYALPDFDFGATQAIATMHGEIGRQALMVSYANSFWALFIACIAIAPLSLLLRVRRNPPPVDAAMPH